MRFTSLPRCLFLAIFAWSALGVAIVHVAAAEEWLHVGFGVADVTPDVEGETPVWMAGQQRNRRATGVNDPLQARAVVLDDGVAKVALVAVDSIGLQYPLIEKVRAHLPDFAHVLVASTHTHEGPDCIGLWGPSPSESGVDPAYLELLEERIVAAIEAARGDLAPAQAEYGTAADPTLLKDYRLPEVLDGVLRTVRFVDGAGHARGILVQWSSHPVEPGGNTLLTRDCHGVTVDALEEAYGCPVIFFAGAVGGLMGTPAPERHRDDQGQPIVFRSYFHYIEVHGNAVASLAQQALDAAQPLRLTPFAIAAKPIAAPLDNRGYRQARAAGVLTRAIYADAGDPEAFGDELPRTQLEGQQMAKTEVAYMRLGDLHVVGIPGELYPELLYGEYPAEPEAGADYPDAPLEPHVTDIVPGEKLLLLGLANDAVGYIIPKRQWDTEAPYAYGRSSPQYGEVNSLGPETARVLMEALQRRVAEVDSR